MRDKEKHGIMAFLAILSVMLMFTTIGLAYEGIKLKREMMEIKEQRDTFRKALIKGNNDIINARKIINANNLVII